jgi:hypothetical protein
VCRRDEEYKMEIKLRVRITGRVKASIDFMLSPVLTHFAPTKASVWHTTTH